MAIYAFDKVLVWEAGPSGTLRVLRNGTVQVRHPDTDALLQTVTADSDGRATFTTTDIPTVVLEAPSGFRDRVTSQDAIEAAAGFTVSEDTAVAALVNNGSSNTRGAVNAAISEEAITEVVTGAGGSTGPNLTIGSIDNRNGSAIASDVAVSVILNPGAGAGQNNIIGGDGSVTVGTATPNATTPGTNASVSVVGGYDNVAGSLSSKIISDHSFTGVETTEGHHAIFGGANNKIIGTGTGYGAIFGGKQCTVSADLGFTQGSNNTVSGIAAAALGDFNTASGSRSMAQGASNTASGAYAQAVGQLNTAAGNFSRAEGQYAHARNPGQRAISNGRISALGDCQTSVTHFIKQTTDAAEVKMLAGTLVTDFVMVRGQSVLVECHFVARAVGGATQGAWIYKTLVAWNATGASFHLGTPTVETLYEANAALDARVDAVSSIGAILPKVTGLAATTINWSARMTTTEVVG